MRERIQERLEALQAQQARLQALRAERLTEMRQYAETFNAEMARLGAALSECQGAIAALSELLEESEQGE